MYIYDRAFKNCTNISTVYYAGSEEQVGQIGVNDDADFLYYPSGNSFTDAEWIYNYTE